MNTSEQNRANRRDRKIAKRNAPITLGLPLGKPKYARLASDKKRRQAANHAIA
jgi:hypothetical protein